MPSGTVKASHQFQIRDSLSPVSEVHGVFSNRDLPSSFLGGVGNQGQ